MSTRDTELPTSVQTDLDQQMLKKRRPWYYLAIFLIILSLFVRQPLVLLAGIFTLLVGFVPELWFRNALRHLVIQQSLKEKNLFFGEVATLSLTVENRKLLPLPWLQVEDTITPPLTVISERDSRRQVIQRDTLISTWLLWSFQRVTRRYRMHCYARGFHILGPVKLRCSDPFGWLEREVRVAANETLLVYPLIAPLETLGLPAVFPMGDRVGQRQLLEDPLWFAGIRDYELGDDPRRIDWKATARAGALRSKIYESTTMHRLLILLDTWTYNADIKGLDFDIQEFCISAAASLMAWGLDEGYMVGLLTNCSVITATGDMIQQVNTDEVPQMQRAQLAALEAQKTDATSISAPGVSVPFALDYEQYEEILSTLARLVPNYNTPIEHVLDVEEEMLQPGTTVLLISSLNILSENTIERLLDIRARGNSINLVLVGTLTEGKEMVDTQDLPVYHLGGKEKWHELVRTVGAGNSEKAGTSATSLQLD